MSIYLQYNQIIGHYSTTWSCTTTQFPYAVVFFLVLDYMGSLVRGLAIHFHDNRVILSVCLLVIITTETAAALFKPLQPFPPSLSFQPSPFPNPPASTASPQPSPYKSPPPFPIHLFPILILPLFYPNPIPTSSFPPPSPVPPLQLLPIPNSPSFPPPLSSQSSAD